VIETTTDRFLGGRVTLQQPARGFRAGLDAVLLAAAVPALAGEQILELGAGCGTASLCLAVRVDGCSIVGIEVDGNLVSLGSVNARQNRVEDRVRFVQGDAMAPPDALKREFSHVFANPPFHRESDPGSPIEGRDRAKRDFAVLKDWLISGLKRARANGTLTMIVRADRLRELMEIAPVGGVALFPLWPRRQDSANRAILQIRKGSKSPFLLMPGLVLHEDDGQYTQAANAILRDASALGILPQAQLDLDQIRPAGS
jgi:tRNA1(Val) A37 N6-methylase TrmN6